MYQDIVDQIQGAILSGKLEVGDMLPPERELKEIFKTSRGTLREALRVLEEKGLIEIKLGVGGGAVVQDATADQMSETLAFMIRFQKISLDHLAEFRGGVEGNVMALAAKRAGQEDVKTLRRLLAAAKVHADEGISQWEDFLAADKNLHLELAQIAGNPIYIFVFKTVHDNIHLYYEQFLPEDERMMQENYQDLSDMVDAVEAADAEHARALVQIHIQRFFEYMKKNDVTSQNGNNKDS